MPGMVLFWELRSVGGAAWRAVGVCLSFFLPPPARAGGGGRGRPLPASFACRLLWLRLAVCRLFPAGYGAWNPSGPLPMAAGGRW